MALLATTNPQPPTSKRQYCALGALTLGVAPDQTWRGAERRQLCDAIFLVLTLGGG